MTSSARRLVAVIAAGLCFALVVPAARAAEPSAAPAPPPLVPPKGIDIERVPYPEGATGDANVVVELIVDKEGKVSRAVIVDGAEPFASAALASAPKWRFSPAKRGDLPVVARIRMLVEFREPARAASKEDVSPPAATAKAASEDHVEEVRVAGQRKEVGATQMSGAEVRQMPGAFGDAFRAIDALPGVTPIFSGLPYYFIRGAPPGNTGYLIDGIRVPLLFHFGVARAVLHPGLIDRVDFFPGGFPAKYGRFAGAIIDGQTKAPADQIHGEWDASILHAGGLVETPFADGRGNVTVAGRYGYPGLLLSLLAPNVFLQYGDYQTRASWKATEKDTVSAFVFGSYDAIGTRENGSLKDFSSTQFHRADLRWDRDLGNGGHVRTALTLGFDQTSNDSAFAVRDYLSGVRSELTFRASNDVRVRAGADALFDHYSLVADGKNDQANFPTRNDMVTGLWADAIVKVSPAVEIVPGVRVDYFGSKTAFEGNAAAVPTFDPRLSTRVRLSKAITWVTATGISHQAPSFLVPVPGLQLGRLDHGVQTAVETSQGAEIALPADFTLAPTLFLHDYLNLSDATASCFGRTDNTDDNCLDQRVRGRTIGVEVLLRRPLTKRLTGWVAYTLSRSTREAHPLDSPERLQTVPSEFDRTHVLNVVGAYDLGLNWRLGARFLYYTGRPYSKEIQGVAVPPYNSERLPPFFRIDARLEKRWLTKTGYVAFVAEGLNVTASREVFDVKCTPSSPPSLTYDKCEPDTKGSIPVIVPSLGFEGAF